MESGMFLVKIYNFSMYSISSVQTVLALWVNLILSKQLTDNGIQFSHFLVAQLLRKEMLTELLQC